tara:strand:+ start:2344 stop:3024 length:681 start_codon:yes stop_codon:yes gene_type:complete
MTQIEKYGKEIVDRFVDDKAYYLYEDDNWGWSFNNVAFFYNSVELLRWLIWTETNDMLSIQEEDITPVDFVEVSTWDMETCEKYIDEVMSKGYADKDDLWLGEDYGHVASYFDWLEDNTEYMYQFAGSSDHAEWTQIIRTKKTDMFDRVGGKTLDVDMDEFTVQELTDAFSPDTKLKFAFRDYPTLGLVELFTKTIVGNAKGEATIHLFGDYEEERGLEEQRQEEE